MMLDKAHYFDIAGFTGYFLHAHRRMHHHQMMELPPHITIYTVSATLIFAAIAITRYAH